MTGSRGTKAQASGMDGKQGAATWLDKGEQSGMKQLAQPSIGVSERMAEALEFANYTQH